MVINTEPGGSTMIRVSMEVRDLIESVKIIPREPLNDCLKRIIKENNAYTKQAQHPIQVIGEPMPTNKMPTTEMPML